MSICFLNKIERGKILKYLVTIVITIAIIGGFFKAVIEEPNPYTIGFFIIIIVTIAMLIYSAHVKYQTGEYRICQTKSDKEQCEKERIRIVLKYNSKKWSHSVYKTGLAWQQTEEGKRELNELRMLREKYAEPGTETRKKVEENIRRWNSGERYKLLNTNNLNETYEEALLNAIIVEGEISE